MTDRIYSQQFHAAHGEEGLGTLADPAGNEVDIATTAAPGVGD